MDIFPSKARARWTMAAILGLVAGLLPGTANAIDWGPGIADVSAPGQYAAAPQLGLSADGGRASAVWLRSDGSHDIVQASSATISGGAGTWGTVTPLSDPGQDASDPQLGLSADGSRATAVWRRFNGSKYLIHSRSATITGTTATWGPVETLSDPAQNAGNPQVQVSADGSRATAVWSHSNGSHDIVQSSSATITGTTATWSTPTPLSASGQSAAVAQVGLSADGSRATAVWRRFDGSNTIVQSSSATIIGNAATWGTATNLSAPGQSAYGPQVGVSADGSVTIAVWQRNDAGNNNIIQSRQATVSGTSASWGPVDNLTTPERDADDPQVALANNGAGATAVWQQYSNSTNWIVQSRSAAISGSSASWDTVTDLSQPGGAAHEAQVAVSADGGRTTTVWQRYDGTSYIVQSRSAMTGGSTASWGQTADLSPVGQESIVPGIGLSADGTMATTVWYGTQGNDQLVQSRTGMTLPQTISFPAPSDTRVDQGPVALSATATSGLPVTYTSQTPGVCTVAGSTANLVSVGTCTVTARQGGDVTFSPAPDVTRSFAVTAAPGPAPSPSPTQSPSPSPTPGPVVPGKVTSVSATSKGGKVTVKWAKPATAVTGFTIQYSPNKKKWKKAGTARPTATKFVWKKGKKGKTYHLRVRASSQAGNGPWSKPAKVKVR